MYCYFNSNTILLPWGLKMISESEPLLNDPFKSDLFLLKKGGGGHALEEHFIRKIYFNVPN